MKINTVNVIEYLANSVLAIHSFDDTDVGNKEAEELFAKIAKENKFSDEEITIGMDDGYVENAFGEYQLFIVHSNC